MSLFREPQANKVGLKVLAMGERGSGKSIFGLSFPKVFALDSEAGLAMYENNPNFNQNLLQIANTQDFNDITDAIDEIEDIVEDDPEAVKTLVIDSETNFYNNLTDAVLEIEERKATKKGRDPMDSNVSMRGWGRIKAIGSRLSALKIDLSAKGVNIISVSQMDDVKKKVGDEFVKVGDKPVMQKGAEYHYDIILKIYTEKNAKGELIRKAEVLKDRTTVTKVGDIVENPSYEIWKDYAESKQRTAKIASNLSGNKKTAMTQLAEEDKAVKSNSDRLKDLMGSSEEIKEKALALIKKAKISNPLNPKADEVDKLDEIVNTLEKMAS